MSLDLLNLKYTLGGTHPVMKLEDSKYLQSFMHYGPGMEPTLYG